MEEIDAKELASIDLIGIGRSMKAIPPQSWARLVDTACETFEAIVSPLTKTLGGIGRLIDSKFDSLSDAQKILVAESFATARSKAKKSRKTYCQPRAQTIIQVMEFTADQVDLGIRELWANLLAQEMIGESAHPEIGRVLNRLCSDDAQLLSAITLKRPTSITEAFALTMKLVAAGLPFASAGPFSETSFNHAHLKNLNLIARNDRIWMLTTFGRGFIKAVSDPSLELGT